MNFLYGLSKHKSWNLGSDRCQYVTLCLLLSLPISIMRIFGEVHVLMSVFTFLVVTYRRLISLIKTQSHLPDFMSCRINGIMAT